MNPMLKYSLARLGLFLAAAAVMLVDSDRLNPFLRLGIALDRVRYLVLFPLAASFVTRSPNNWPTAPASAPTARRNYAAHSPATIRTRSAIYEASLYRHLLIHKPRRRDHERNLRLRRRRRMGSASVPGNGQTPSRRRGGASPSWSPARRPEPNHGRTRPADTSAQYQVIGPKTWADANTVAADRRGGRRHRARQGVHHRDARRGRRDPASSASRSSDARARSRGSTDRAAVRTSHRRLGVPQLRRDGRRAEPDRGRPPGHRAAAVDRPSYEGRNIYALKISDNVATDENEPEVLYNAPPARAGAPDRRDGAVPGEHVHQRLRQRHPGHQRREHAARSGSCPTSTRTAASTTSPPAPTGRGARTASPTAAAAPVGTDLNRNWGYNWGCCGGSSGTPSSETYRGPSAFSAPETAGVPRLRAQPAGRRRAADQGEHRLPHLLAAGPVAVRLHDRQHRARA